MKFPKFRIISVSVILLCMFSPVLKGYASDKIEQNQESLEDIERRNALSILYSEESKNAVLSAGYTLGTRVVERGETWESIAAQYNVAVDLIKNLNSEYDECLAGTELSVPIAPEVSPDNAEVCAEVDPNSVLYIARHKLQFEDYKKAVKEYDEVIKKHPCIEAYYERAYAQYKRGKLKQAVSDLQVVQGYADYDAKYPDTDDLLAGINEEWSAKKAQRAQLWTSIVGAVLVTGLEVGNAVLQAKYGSTPSWSSSNGLNFSGYSGYAYSSPNFAAPQTSYYANGVTVPDCLKPENYISPQMAFGEFSFDQFGNTMYSNEQLANALRKMDSDFAGYMYNSGLFNTSTIGRFLLGTMNSAHYVNEIEYRMMATPHYVAPEYTNEYSSEQSGFDEDSSLSDEHTNTNYSPQVLSLTHIYDEYVSVLIGMKTGTVPYDKDRIIRSQKSMAEIRESLSKYGFNQPVSSWENWDGRR